MDIEILILPEELASDWDTYVHNHPDATLYHQYAWKKVIEKTYGHSTFYLAAFCDHKIQGVLPLVHMKHFLFGNTLLSMPFFDMGGLLADDRKTADALVQRAVELGRSLKADEIELRHTRQQDFRVPENGGSPICLSIQQHKVRMLLPLPSSSDELMKSFKSKLRSQIKKPMKEGLEFTIGREELLDDFYSVFLTNMRDLGSPVHSKKLMKNVLEYFSDQARIVMVSKEGVPYAASLICGFKDTLENPWASSLRQYSRLSPNMLLYWAMLSYACDNGFQYFDFGRSTPDEGTFRFKKQWGSEPQPLFWQKIHFGREMADEEEGGNGVSKFDRAVALWQKLPVGVTRILGPMVRKHIGL